MNGTQGMNGKPSIDQMISRNGSNDRVARGPERSEIDLLHKNLQGYALHCRQQQMELHELRCTVREYKAIVDNMADEMRMIRQLLDKKWLASASPRVVERVRGNGARDDGSGYYADGEHAKTQSAAGNGKSRGGRGSRGGDTAVTHEEIVELACTVLRRYPGGMAIAKLGTLMHKEANNHALPSILKERYGGLKKFLQGQQDKCVMGNDHPYNPHVTLRRNTNSNYLQANPAPSNHHQSPAPPSSLASPVQLGIPGPPGGGAIGDPLMGIDSPSAYGRRAQRRRRSKKTRSNGISPSGETRSPNSQHELLLRGGHPSSAAVRLLANTTPVAANSLRATGSAGYQERVPTHPRHSSTNLRSLGWSGVVSAPGTPLGAHWTDRENGDKNTNGMARGKDTSATPDAGSRPSSLFTSALSSRLRTNVLKSAYTIRLPAYTGGTKMTRLVSLACGMVQVGINGSERGELRIGRIVVVNLYGHVLFDEIIRPPGDILDYNTEESGVSPADMKRATTLTAARSLLQKMLVGRTVIALDMEYFLMELHLSIPARSIRNIAQRMYTPTIKSLPELIEKVLGLSASVRNPIEDGRALMALYWHVHEEWERNFHGASHRVSGGGKASWPLPSDSLAPHEEVKIDSGADENTIPAELKMNKILNGEGYGESNTKIHVTNEDENVKLEQV
mmetsp:Transcript_3460/g.5358  ORF Transcript_3460/g.5358 Transcript_3460/m.5358 type:complete len:677 (+) Transcript_3460:152-2182(+)|eukprot:jgi/Bigna1/87891/estExt_fgenesh1_pg.C_250139